jgi:Mg2+ and Co2+ transporter CorA
MPSHAPAVVRKNSVRKPIQSAKVEESRDYLFAVLKPVELNQDGTLDVGDLDFFLGRDFLITVQESRCTGVRPILEGYETVLYGAGRPEKLWAD